MKLHFGNLDYGHLLTIWVRRGPFRQGISIRTTNTRLRVPVARRRAAIRKLRAWARASRTPAFRFEHLPVRAIHER